MIQIILFYLNCNRCSTCLKTKSLFILKRILFREWNTILVHKTRKLFFLVHFGKSVKLIFFVIGLLKKDIDFYLLVKRTIITTTSFGLKLDDVYIIFLGSWCKSFGLNMAILKNIDRHVHVFHYEKTPFCFIILEYTG